MPKESGGGGAKHMKKPAPITGLRKKQILKEGKAQEKVDTLVAALKKTALIFPSAYR